MSLDSSAETHPKQSVAKEWFWLALLCRIALKSRIARRRSNTVSKPGHVSLEIQERSEA